MRRRLILTLAVLCGLTWPVVGDLVSIAPQYWYAQGPVFSSGSAVALNASGESRALVGYVHLSDRSGSHTISAAGSGKIYWNTATGNVFADAGTELRVGLQDVSGDLEDGTFDVYEARIGGTDTVTNNAIMVSTMTSGTKTLSQGDLVAIVVEMVTRGGSDAVGVDTVAHRLFSGATIVPWGSVDTGTLTRVAAGMVATIEFDDGTFGWIDPFPLLLNLQAGFGTTAFNQTSTPDEYAAIIRVPVAMTVTAFGLSVGSVGSADTFEMIFYTDPLGTPVAAATLAVNTSPTPGIGGAFTKVGAAITLAAGTDYAIALRPTSNNNIFWQWFDLGTVQAELKSLQPFSAIYEAARTDQTGAFSATADTHHLPDIWIAVSALDDGAGGGGGGASSHVFVQ